MKEGIDSMYFHHKAMREFKYRHPYLYVMIVTFTMLMTLALCGICGLGPILLCVYVHWAGLFTWLITIPLAAALVKFGFDLFEDI